jgi:cysteine synthase
MTVKRSTWWGTAVGTAVGTGGWLLGIGRFVWPAHPLLAIFALTVASGIITQITVDWEIRHNIARAQNAQPPSPPQAPQR